MEVKTAITERLKSVCIIAFCLLIPALYNSFPLVTSDTGAYIENAFKLYMPNDRSPGYSVFLRLSSAHITLWGTVIAQALLLGFLMDVIIRQLLGTQYSSGRMTAIALLTGVCTSAGWFCGQLMPDIFTAILLLTLIIYFTFQELKTWQIVLLCVVVFGCVVIHNSNLLITLCAGAAITLHAIIKKRRMLRRRGLIMTGIGCIGWLALSTCYAISGKGFGPSPSSHVFIMSRMAENGILDKFLDEHCESGAYKICAYRGHTGLRQWDFMWGDESPLNKTGGWDANKAEYTSIIHKTLTNPKYLCLHVLKNSEATFRQLPLIYVGDGLGPQMQNSNPYWKVNESFHHQIKEYSSSLQQTGGLRIEWWNALIVLFFAVSVATALLLKWNRLPQFRHIIWLSALFIFINAGITATFSTVVGRFEARVAWVLPFLALIWIVKVLTGNRDFAEYAATKKEEPTD